MMRTTGLAMAMESERLLGANTKQNYGRSSRKIFLILLVLVSKRIVAWTLQSPIKQWNSSVSKRREQRQKAQEPTRECVEQRQQSHTINSKLQPDISTWPSLTPDHRYMAGRRNSHRTR